MLETAISTLGASGAISAVALKAPDLIKQIYGDLARPGVIQVGKALENVLGLGNTILIPLRLLNETGQVAEKRIFDILAEKFAQRSIEDIKPIVADIGVPILDKLSVSTDEMLTDMYAELLAKAATEGVAETVHPSFVHIIGSMSPDEAILIKGLRGARERPFIRIKYKQVSGTASRVIDDLVFSPFVDLRNHNNMPLYIANLSGLGIIEISRDAWLSDGEIYEKIFQSARVALGVEDKAIYENESYELSYDKGMTVITELGKRFVSACVGDVVKT